MNVSTNQYEFSHGKRPRGEGNWAFSLGGDGKWLAEPFWHRGLYSEAVVAAKREAKRLGLDQVVALP